MNNHAFGFDGGEILAKMGASWFVSYAYHCHVDKASTNWERVATSTSRKSNYNNSKQYHNLWLKQVLQMNDKNLNRNSIGLKAVQIKEMTRAIIKTIENKSQ